MMSAESDGPLRIVAVAVSITNSSLGAWVGEGLAVVMRLLLRRDERLPEREEMWVPRFGLCALVGRRDPKRQSDARKAGCRTSRRQGPTTRLAPASCHLVLR